MGHRKKQSPILTKSEYRLSGLKSIGPKVDLGHGLTTASFEKLVTEFRQKQEAHNTMLSKIDESANQLKQLERELSVAAENVLLGVKMKYGKDSNQYEMVGGTRQSERRRRKAQTASGSAVMV